MQKDEDLEKKTHQEETEEVKLKEKQSETRQKEGGKNIWPAIIYIIVIAVILFVIYFLTRYSSQTFKINNL